MDKTVTVNAILTIIRCMNCEQNLTRYIGIIQEPNPTISL